MDTGLSNDRDGQIRPEQVLALVRGIFSRDGERPGEEPLPPGPWDPVIRAAVRDMDVFGPP